jgi:hypothetical protein
MGLSQFLMVQLCPPPPSRPGEDELRSLHFPKTPDVMLDVPLGMQPSPPGKEEMGAVSPAGVVTYTHLRLYYYKKIVWPMGTDNAPQLLARY